MVRSMNASNVNDVENLNAEHTDGAGRGQGAARLRKAADQVLSRDSMMLAEALSKSGQDGKIQSTKFIYQLSDMENGEEDREDAEAIRRLALELANAPPWKGPLPSETDDVTEEDLAYS